MQVGHLDSSSCVSAVNDLVHIWHKAGMQVGDLNLAQTVCLQVIILHLRYKVGMHAEREYQWRRPCVWHLIDIGHFDGSHCVVSQHKGISYSRYQGTHVFRRLDGSNSDCVT